MQSIFKKIRYWYGRFERPVSSLSLIGGFIFDAITLRRVDALWENLWVIGHLVIVATFMLLIFRTGGNEGDEADPEKAHFWYVNIVQFFFGGLLSTYLVFYFRSADILATWPFLLLLALAFGANESFKRRFVRMTFQISLLYLSIYAFAIYLLPIVTHRVSTAMFLLSGLVSLFLILAFVHFLIRADKQKFIAHRSFVYSSIIGITILINALYFTNLIPPLPLSLKDGDISHSVLHKSDGSYELGVEDLGWKKYITLYDDFHVLPGQKAVAWSSVFAPTDLQIVIIHEWQYYNEATGAWQTAGKTVLSVRGGREGGFRTYSARNDLLPGKWRVNIETEEGKLIGRLRFLVIAKDALSVPLAIKVSN